MYEELLETLKSDFWKQFWEADKKWIVWVINCYRRLMKENLKNVEMITEIALVTNWKCWEHYEKWNMELSRFYEKLWFEVDTYCLDHFKWKDKEYYIRRTD